MKLHLRAGQVLPRSAIGPVGLVVLLSVCFGWACRPQSEGRGERPNVLLITLDTTRADRLGCYGYTNAVTPNLNGLADAGVVFDDMQACAPLTLPSHATMLTGLTPPQHGLRVNGVGALPADIPTLAEVLQLTGYRTAAVVASPVLIRTHGLARGFEHYDDRMPEPPREGAGTPGMRFNEDPQHSPYRPGAEIADAALGWLKGVAATNALVARPSPWLLWVHFYDPHTPGHWHHEIFGNHFNSQYNAELAYMDMQIGRLFDYLGQAGLKEKTLVVAAGDHGEGLGDNGEDSHGFFLYGSTQHVPLIVTRKGRIPAGNRVGATLSLADLMPTVLDLLEVPKRPYPSRRDPRNTALQESRRRSFAPAVSGVALPSRACYMETFWPYFMFHWAPLFGLVNENHKYIRAPRPEVYDRHADAGEQHNLAETEARLADELALDLEDMEKAFEKREAEQVSLTEEELQRLRSLGYVVGGQSPVGLPSDFSGLADVKDMKGIISLEGSVRSKLGNSITLDATLADCLRLVTDAPDTALFRTWLGSIYAARGDTTNALASFEAALKIAPDAFHAHNNLGILLARTGRLLEAIPHFEKAYLAKPEDVDLRANLAKALEQAGIALSRAGYYTEALACFDRVVFLHPDVPSAHLHQGHARAGLKDREGALRAYRRALELKPDYEPARKAIEGLMAAPPAAESSS